jgi:hypothetical protein
LLGLYQKTVFVCFRASLVLVFFGWLRFRVVVVLGGRVSFCSWFRVGCCRVGRLVRGWLFRLCRLGLFRLGGRRLWLVGRTSGRGGCGRVVVCGWFCIGLCRIRVALSGGLLFVA